MPRKSAGPSNVPAGYKWCPKCKLIKNRDEFNRNIKAADGLQIYCRPCHNVNQLAYFHKRKDRFRDEFPPKKELKRRYAAMLTNDKQPLPVNKNSCPIANNNYNCRSCNAPLAEQVLLCNSCNHTLATVADEVLQLVLIKIRAVKNN